MRNEYEMSNEEKQRMSNLSCRFISLYKHEKSFVKIYILCIIFYKNMSNT